MRARPTAPLGKDEWVRRALWLLGFSIAYNVIEGLLAAGFGLAANSIALVAFGLDSAIECAASAVLFWRMAIEAREEDEGRIERAEERARRFIALSFLALAAYVTVEAGLTLWNGETPETSLVGIVLAILSLLIMPTLAWRKLSVARNIGSRALEGEAKESAACAFLAAVTLAGLVANAALGWWWADPLAGLAMVPWLIREGFEGLQGEAD